MQYSAAKGTQQQFRCAHYLFIQEEHRLERQEERLHQKAVHAALHGNIGKAVALEVSLVILFS